MPDNLASNLTTTNTKINHIFQQLRASGWDLTHQSAKMLAGLGLSSVFLDVLRRENMRAVHLIKVFNNENIFSQADIEL